MKMKKIIKANKGKASATVLTALAAATIGAAPAVASCGAHAAPCSGYHAEHPLPSLSGSNST